MLIQIQMIKTVVGQISTHQTSGITGNFISEVGLRVKVFNNATRFPSLSKVLVFTGATASAFFKEMMVMFRICASKISLYAGLTAVQPWNRALHMSEASIDTTSRLQ